MGTGPSTTRVRLHTRKALLRVTIRDATCKNGSNLDDLSRVAVIHMQIKVFVDCAAHSGYPGILPSEWPPVEDCLTSITNNEQVAVIRLLQRQLRTLKPGLGEVLSFVDQDSVETVRISFPALQSITEGVAP